MTLLAQPVEGCCKEPEKTAEASDAEGLFPTAYIGLLDADGQVMFHGRI
jgi:long-subunit acyl-CoA synthetase (AMP-forming)